MVGYRKFSPLQLSRRLHRSDSPTGKPSRANDHRLGPCSFSFSARLPPDNCSLPSRFEKITIPETYADFSSRRPFIPVNFIPRSLPPFLLFVLVSLSTNIRERSNTCFDAFTNERQSVRDTRIGEESRARFVSQVTNAISLSFVSPRAKKNGRNMATDGTELGEKPSVSFATDEFAFPGR